MEWKLLLSKSNYALVFGRIKAGATTIWKRPFIAPPPYINRKNYISFNVADWSTSSQRQMSRAIQLNWVKCALLLIMRSIIKFQNFKENERCHFVLFDWLTSSKWKWRPLGWLCSNMQMICKLGREIPVWTASSAKIWWGNEWNMQMKAEGSKWMESGLTLTREICKLEDQKFAQR